MQQALLCQLRKLMSLENLMLTLCLVILVPEGKTDRTSFIETLEDLEELKECYQNLGLD